MSDIMYKTMPYVIKDFDLLAAEVTESGFLHIQAPIEKGLPWKEPHSTPESFPTFAGQ